MKVLVISHMYPSTKNDSYGIFVHQQVKELSNSGCDIIVVSPVPYVPFPLKLLSKKWNEYSNIPKKSIIEGIEVYYPRYLEFPKSFFLEYSGIFMYLGIRKTIKRINKFFKFDLIHSHVVLPDGYAVMILNNTYKVPHVTTVHGQDLQYTIDKNIRCRRNLHKVFNKADLIITVSAKLKNLLSNKVLSNKVRVINNGFESEQMVSQNNKISNLKGEIILLTVGSLIKTKGIDISIKAVSKLVVKYPEIKYYIIGEGEQKDELLNLVERLNLKKHVYFLGRLHHNEVIQYMINSDIFVLPSWQEGFGVVYIEAMSCGIPVIGVKGEGIEDVIEHNYNGFLVEPKNINDIINTVEFILSNPDKSSAIAKNGEITVKNNFTWKANAIKTISLYKKLTEEINLK